MIDTYYFNMTILNDTTTYSVNEHKVTHETFFRLQKKLTLNNYCMSSRYQSSMYTKNYYHNTITQVWRIKEDET